MLRDMTQSRATFNFLTVERDLISPGSLINAFTMSGLDLELQSTSHNVMISAHILRPNTYQINTCLYNGRTPDLGYASNSKRTRIVADEFQKNQILFTLQNDALKAAIYERPEHYETFLDNAIVLENQYHAAPKLITTQQIFLPNFVVPSNSTYAEQAYAYTYQDLSPDNFTPIFLDQNNYNALLESTAKLNYKIHPMQFVAIQNKINGYHDSSTAKQHILKKNTASHFYDGLASVNCYSLCMLGMEGVVFLENLYDIETVQYRLSQYEAEFILPYYSADQKLAWADKIMVQHIPGYNSSHFSMIQEAQLVAAASQHSWPAYKC